MSNFGLGSSASAGDDVDGFTQRFGQLMATLNLSQNEFARQIGSTSAFVSNMARGKSKPGLDFLRKIADTFDVSLDWLVLGIGSPRGERSIDPEWHHAVLLRVVLAQLAAAGNVEAQGLAQELLTDAPIGRVTAARQDLLDELAAKTSHGSLLATLYNRFMPKTDVHQRSRDALRAALQELRSSASDPLAALLNQNKPAAGPRSDGTQIQTGSFSRMAGRDFNER